MRDVKCCSYLTEHKYYGHYCKIKNQPVVRNCYEYCKYYYSCGEALSDKLWGYEIVDLYEEKRNDEMYGL